MSEKGVGTLVTLKARPGLGDELLAYLARETRYVSAEEHTPIFLISRSSEDPDTIYLFEAYRNATAQEAHRANPDTARVKAGLPPMLAEPPRIARLHDTIGKGLFPAT
jgi:quinol monooxygenase YgiN